MSAVRLTDGWRLALGTLTALPTRPPARLDHDVARTAMLLTPVAALWPALLVGAASWAGIEADAPPLLVAVLTVGLLALSSRGLHLDGLADTADGLASGFDRERALAVMRRGDVGPAGAATFVLVLAAQVASLATLIGVAEPALALLPGVAVVASRTMLCIPCAAGIPAARAEGLGAAVAGTVPRAAALTMVLGVGLLASLVAGQTELAWWAGAVAVSAAVVAAGAVTTRCLQRLGGVSGDVLGAVTEVSFAAALVALALCQ